MSDAIELDFRTGLGRFLASTVLTPEQVAETRRWRLEKSRDERLAVARGHRERIAKLHRRLDRAAEGPHP